jgi:hypothetical protein
MSEGSGDVTVHQFEVWDIAAGGWVSSRGKATAEFIIKEAKGRAIPGTAQDVPPGSLDPDGRCYLSERGHV